MDEKVSTFCSITGADPEQAVEFLGRYDGDLETAVQRFFEPPRPHESSTEIPANSSFEGDAVPEEGLRAGGHTQQAGARQPQQRSFLSALPVVGWLFGGGEEPEDQDARTNEAGMDPISRETTTCISNYERQFGRHHPDAFPGTFEQAVAKARREFKFVLVYLHSSLHDDTASFCRDSLGSDTIVDMVNHNFLFWMGSISLKQGYLLSSSLGVTSYPFMGLVYTLDGRMTAVGHKEGSVGVEDLASWFTDVLETHGPQLIVQRNEQQGLDQARQLRDEQDREYLEGLERDRLREREEEEARQAKERAELEAAMAEERRQEMAKQQEEDLAARVLAAKSSLPPEPAAGEPSAHIAVRLPAGGRLVRRFNASHKVEVLYLWVLGFAELEYDDFELCMSHPRKILSDREVTLEEAGLMPQAALFVDRPDRTPT